MKLCVVACSKSKIKESGKHKAKDLYTGGIFKKSMNYADEICDKTVILSAKHGVISPDKRISKYDFQMKDIPYDKKYKWKEQRVEELLKLSKKGDTVVFLTPHGYKRGIISRLKKRKTEWPLKYLRQGQQLRWLTKQLEKIGG
jgi:hypothetical protein